MKLLITFSLLCSAALLFADIPKGDGFIVDNVARDITCTGASCSSAFMKGDYQTYVVPGNINTVYLFPDIGSFLNVGTTKIQATCPGAPTYKQPTDIEVTLVGYPQIKRSLHPDVATSYGKCVSAAGIKQAYSANTGGKTVVILPMISGNAYDINFGSTSFISSLASTIATGIKSNGFNGVSFDLEGPSLGETNGAKGVTNAVNFIKDLSADLGSSRYIAIFDGGKLYSEPNMQNLKNVFALYALYDGGTLNGAVPSCKTVRPSGWNNADPYSPAQYQKCGIHANAYIAKKTTIPVMYVLPATATTQLYTSTEVYNEGIASDMNNFNRGVGSTGISSRGIGAGDPAPAVIANVIKTGVCQQPNNEAIPTDWLMGDKQLCKNSSNVKNLGASAPGIPLPPGSASKWPIDAGGYVCIATMTNWTEFLNQDNCTSYQNLTKNSAGNTVTQSDYVDIALNQPSVGVKAVMQKSPDSVVGVAFYSLKNEGTTTNGIYSPSFYNIACAKRNYLPALGEKKEIEQCMGYLPNNVTPGVWAVYKTFRQ